MTNKLIERIYKQLNNIKKFILGILFPSFCVNCKKESWWVCKECAQEIVLVKTQTCPECGKISDLGRLCPKCKKEKHIKGIICACYYDLGPIKEMVHNLKYNSVVELSEVLGGLMARALALNFKLQITNIKSKTNNKMLKPKSSKYKVESINGESKIHNTLYLIPNTVLTFVPMHWLRQARRGYNQAELLAKEVSKNTNIPVLNLLQKIRSTKRQVELTGKERRENLKIVFKVIKSQSHSFARKFSKENYKVIGKKIIIIDDVTTTGSTLNECAKVLIEAGAKEVWGLVVARG